MTQPPPLPPSTGRGLRKGEDDRLSNYFWTITLVSLCLVGILFLLLLMFLAQGGGDRGAGPSAGSGEVAEAKGVGDENSKTAGSGSANDSGETGSTPKPANAAPELAGNEAEISEPEASAAEAAQTTSESESGTGSDGPAVPSESAPLDDPAEPLNQGAGERTGAAAPVKKNTISFAEPVTETPLPEAVPAENPDESETTNEPRSKGPEIGLFSKPEASFFGVNVEAESIAFVVDASSSMLGPTPEVLRTKFERLKEELMRSVKGLSKKQLFTVVMFSDLPLPNPSFHRVKPSPEKIQDLENVLANTFPLGGTDPTGAMAMVLQEDYDVIFLLSDGEFDSGAIDWIHQQNSRHIVICTICLGADAITLQKIAKDSGGRYKSVK